jgi:hypothetical protein
MRNKRANAAKATNAGSKPPGVKTRGRTARLKNASSNFAVKSTPAGGTRLQARNANTSQKRNVTAKAPLKHASSIEENAYNVAKVGIAGAQLQSGRKYDLSKEAAVEVPEDRHCICDELVVCSECTVDAQCTVHDGLFCSSCYLWFHARCIGGTITVNDGFKHMDILSEQGTSRSILLHGPSQDADPWFCIRCCEAAESAKCVGRTHIPFEEISLDEQALRLGVDRKANKFSDPTLLEKYKEYADALPGTIGNDELAKSILANTPMAYPTPKPMDEDAKFNLKFAGRRFEIAQLCIDIDICSCCGVTRPYDNDPWKGVRSMTGQTMKGSHLRKQYHYAHWYGTPFLILSSSTCILPF